MKSNTKVVIAQVIVLVFTLMLFAFLVAMLFAISPYVLAGGFAFLLAMIALTWALDTLSDYEYEEAEKKDAKTK